MRIKLVVHKVCYHSSVSLSFSFILFLLCWVAFTSGLNADHIFRQDSSFKVEVFFIFRIRRRDENWWQREQQQKYSVGRLEEHRCGCRKVQLICSRCTTQPSNISVFCYFMLFIFLCGVGVDLPLLSPCGTWPRTLSHVSREWLNGPDNKWLDASRICTCLELCIYWTARLWRYIDM